MIVKPMQLTFEGTLPPGYEDVDNGEHEEEHVSFFERMLNDMWPDYGPWKLTCYLRFGSEEEYLDRFDWKPAYHSTYDCEILM